MERSDMAEHRPSAATDGAKINKGGFWLVVCVKFIREVSHCQILVYQREK
jgi:hypothetical protein